MDPVQELTMPEKILVAAATLTKEGSTPFHKEALIMKVWRLYPRTFGLKYFTEESADSNKVLTSVFGERGLVRRGLLAREDQDLYRLTGEGEKIADRLSEDIAEEGTDAKEQPAEPSLPVADEKALLTLMKATAFTKYQQGFKNELTFADACRFWSLSENMEGDRVSQQVNGITSFLTHLRKLLPKGRMLLLSNRQVVGVYELDELVATHDYCQERFSRHLNLMRNRRRTG